MYKAYNPNPEFRRTEDCTVRAVAKAFGVDWLTAYDWLVEEGRKVYDMPRANHVWMGFLEHQGFRLYAIPYTCPDCYLLRDFAADHPRGEYIVGDGRHVVTVIDGDWYDTWNSGDMAPTFYMARG